MLHGYSRRPSKDSRPHRIRDSRAEFLTTARILSLAGQLVAGISRERINFSSPVVLHLTMHFDFVPIPLPFFVASLSVHSFLFFSFSYFSTISSNPMNAFGSQERSFSSFRNATLRSPLFSHRISLIFCFLFQVLRTTVQSGLQGDFVNLKKASQLEYEN